MNVLKRYGMRLYSHGSLVTDIIYIYNFNCGYTLFTVSIFEAPSTQPTVAKATIMGLHERMSELQSEATTLQTYQIVFDVSINKFVGYI